MTHTRWLVGLLVLTAGACGDGDPGGNGHDGGGGSGGGGSAVQLLTFTGPISGSMLEANTDCARFSSTPPRLEVTLDGKVADVDRRVKIVINNYGGMGSYGGNAVQVEIAGTTVTGDEASVAMGEKSGTVDSATNTQGNKVSGSWSCASAPVMR